MSLNRDLYDAVADGDEERTRRLLTQGADPNAVATHIGESGMRPILVAANFFPFLIEPLVVGGARLDQEYRDTGSGRVLRPMNFAAREDSGESIAVLVRLGVNVLSHSDALFDAACLSSGAENIERLASFGADPDVRVGHNRNTPLLMAAYLGHLECSRALIAGGADLDARDFRDNSALRFAVQQGHPQIVLALLEAGAPIDAGMELREFWGAHVKGLEKSLRVIASHLMARRVGGAMSDSRASGGPSIGKPDVAAL